MDFLLLWASQVLQTKFQVLPVAYGSPTMGKYVCCKAWFTLCLPKTALQPCLLLFNCHGKLSIFAIICDKSKLLKSKQKAPNFWSSTPSNCISLQKYPVFSIIQDCIVPPKSNKLIACVWNVAKTCVLDSFKTVILFLSFQRILSIWNRFQPVLQGKPLEQIRIPTALPAVSFISAVRLIEGLFCVHVQNRHTLVPAC